MGTNTPFVGRSHELELIEELVEGFPLVSLVGPGGIGKTRLAREFAEIAAGRFDQVLFATLAGAGPQDDVFEVVARESGLSSVDALRVGALDQPRLVILDNCETALGGAGAVAAELMRASVGTRVLATSRMPLGVPGERVVPVGTLAVPDTDDVDAASASPAVQVFIDRAQRAGALATLDDAVVLEIGRLVRKLDGMPLAIELAASRARVLSPGQIRARLDDQLGLLRRGGAVDERHRSMGAAIVGSYEPLAADAQAGFRALCMIGGPFDVTLAHAMLRATDELGTVDLLGDLIDASLVVPVVEDDGHRYRILEPIRLYGVDQLVAAGEAEEVADRFVDAMVGYADAFVAAVLETFSAEVFAGVNDRFSLLVHAIDRCITHDPTAERANRMFLPLFGAAQSRAQLIALARRMSATWTEPAPLHFEARAVMATTAVFGGDDDLGKELAEEILAQEDAGILPNLLAHRALGYLAAYNGDRPAARRHLGCALVDAEDLSPAFAREIECSLCATAATDDEIATSLERLTELVPESMEANDLVTAQWALMVAAELHVRRGELDDALACANRTIELAPDAAYQWSLGAAHRTVGVVSGLLEGWAAATPHLQIALDRCLAHGDLGGAAKTTREAAGLALRLGHAATAEALWATFPTRLGRSIIPSMVGAEEEVLRERCGEVGDVDLAQAVRAARAVLGPVAAPATPKDASPTAEPASTASTTPGATPVPRSVLRFEDCELDLELFELRRAGERVHVEPQVFDVLAYLVERRGAVVTKEELLDEVWGDRFVSESALTSRIKAARQATGDDGETQRIIRTVRGRGYTFVADVR